MRMNMNNFTGFFEIFGANSSPDSTEAGHADLQQGLPTLVYYSRKSAGTPKISPKAGNMYVPEVR